MVDRLAVGLAKSVVVGAISKIESAIEEDTKLRQKAHCDLVSITLEFEMIQSFLDVAKEESIMNNMVRTWVRHVRELAYDLEDCVEFVILARAGRSLPLDQAVEDLAELKGRADELSKCYLRYSNITGSVASKLVMMQKQQGVSSAIALDMLLKARDAADGQKCRGDLTQLITQDGHPNSDLQVISVWGSEGNHGTTSVIMTTYNASEIRNSYTYRAWVKLMHPFNPHDFVRNLMAQFFESSFEEQGASAIGIQVLTKMDQATQSQSDLLKEFEQLVTEKRYLVVLEDLSNMAEWHAIRTFLPHRKTASRIIVSTKESEMACLCIGDSYQILELMHFSPEHSVCALFKKGSSSGDEDKGKKPMVQDSILIGRESQMNELRKYPAIARMSSSQVMSVWGIAGVGKSALVRDLCNIDDTKQPEEKLFNRYCWVNVSHPFNLKYLCQDLLSDFHSEKDPIKECHQLLIQDRCLIVIDGIRYKKEWDLIKKSVVPRSSKSVIIVITTEASIATYCANNRQLVFNVKGLEAAAAFDLFKQEVRKTSLKLETPSADPSSSLKLDTPSGDPSSSLKLDTPSGDPSSSLKLDTPSADPSSSLNLDTPSADPSSSLNLDTPSEDPSSSLNLDTPSEDPSSSPKLDTPSADPSSSPKLDTPSADPSSSLKLDTPLADPSSSLKLDTPSADPSSSVVDWCEAEEVKELILKCGGLPKVIVAIACALAKQTVTRMDTILALNRRLMHHLETEPDYDSLHDLFGWMHSYFRTCPDSLKPCIFYMSIFPQGQIIRRRRLIRRWIAESYSREDNEESAEENGERQFSDLLDLSMIQQVPQLVTTAEFNDRKMALCKFNSFIREYIIPLRKEENLVFELGGNCALTTQRTGRHLVILDDWDRDRIVFESIDFSRLRSLTVFGKWKSFFISERMKLLRVLDLEDATSDITTGDLKKVVKRLCRLKFLSLRGHTEIDHLPSSLGDLRQLQTLDVRDTSIVTLPASITKLKKLQYIRAGRGTTVSALPASSCWLRDFCRCRQLVGVQVPGEIGNLTGLHTLGVVNVAASGGRAAIKEIKKLSQLRKLGVSGINKHNSKDFFSAISVHVHLDSLSVQMDIEGCLDDILLPLKNLRSLKLYGLGNKLPEGSGQLSKLQKLDLEMDSLTENDMTLLGELPQLCILRVKQLQDGELHFHVIRNGLEDHSFEKVKVLHIASGGSSSSLHVKFGSETMKKLELLKVDCCGGSPTYQFSSLENLEELKQVLLVNGSNAQALKEQLESQLAEHPNLVKPVVELEEPPHSS
ncbi:disease resistance protein Pik-2-like [Triticum urartu]|uniref:disease resistance protein Pik-2-like n=1 Tax=Triticum urartu TaxID=4572 RepID=UPI0020432EDB|nr:disease resistance protein Pik-2-like [Triticum urartu]